jgi:hypothetical protein
MTDQPMWITNLDLKRFLVALRSNDDVGAVIRSHYELERAAIRALGKLYPNYDALQHRYFSQHIRALAALRAEGKIFQAARYINKVRNGFAHEGVEEITQKHLAELCSQVSGAFANVRDVREFVATLDSVGPKPLGEFPLRQQFVAIAAMCAAAIDTIPERDAAAKLSA